MQMTAQICIAPAGISPQYIRMIVPRLKYKFDGRFDKNLLDFRSLRRFDGWKDLGLEPYAYRIRK